MNRPAGEDGPNADLKAKMREALEKKKQQHHGVDPAVAKESVHGSEVSDNSPKMHRRKAGGGGS
ncbi:MAG: DUF5302 domain-containing protein [Nocardioides sp.]|jgi:hypothetical protein